MGLQFTSAAAGGSSASLQPKDSPLLLSIPAWTNQGAPSTHGPYSVANFDYLAGVAGLNPGGTASTCGITIRWYQDAAATIQIGVQTFGMTYLIPSQAQLHIANEGPYFTITITPLTGPCPFSAHLFGTNRPGLLPLSLPDPIMIDEAATTINANSSQTFYPADYYAGPIRVYLNAPVEPVYWTLYGQDNGGNNWPLDRGTSGSTTFGWSTLAPFGTWFVVVSNADTVNHAVDFAVQASFTGSC